MSSAPTIHLENIQISFDKVELFKDLTLTLQAGLWTCLLGQSGVGKSTILRAIAGIDNGCHRTGNISFSSQNQEVAYMGQEAYLLPWLSVLDNVMLGSKLRRETPDKQAALVMLHKVGLGDSSLLMPAQLSGGMQQRCALARTLLENRDVILMDEPFSALDAVSRHELQMLTYELLQDRTVLLVTHDPLEALRLGNTIYVLEGRPAKVMPPIKISDPAPRMVGDKVIDHYYPLLMGKLSNAQRISQ